MRYFVTLPGGDEIAVDLHHGPGGSLSVLVDGEPVTVDAVEVDGATNVRVDGRMFDLWLDRSADAYAYVGSGHRARAQVENSRTRMEAEALSRRSAGAGGGRVIAPMPGRVVKVLVEEGAVVPAGAPVIVVEAMKMENELATTTPGMVTKICVTVGQAVDAGADLVLLGPVG